MNLPDMYSADPSGKILGCCVLYTDGSVPAAAAVQRDAAPASPLPSRWWLPRAAASPRRWRPCPPRVVAPAGGGVAGEAAGGPAARHGRVGYLRRRREERLGPLPAAAAAAARPAAPPPRPRRRPTLADPAGGRGGWRARPRHRQRRRKEEAYSRRVCGVDRHRRRRRPSPPTRHQQAGASRGRPARQACPPTRPPLHRRRQCDGPRGVGELGAARAGGLTPWSPTSAGMAAEPPTCEPPEALRPPAINAQ